MFGGGSSLRVGQISGHEIRIDPIGGGIFVLFVVSRPGSLQGSASFLVAAFLSILWHELGHAAAIRRLLHEDAVIVLGFGGVTISRGARDEKKQLLISLAGPFAGFVLGAIGWGIAHFTSEFYGPWPWEFYSGHSIWLMTLYYIVWISCLWGILNLAPAIPLDGGQALRALLVVIGVSRRPARTFTRRLSMAIAAAAGYWGYTTGHMIIAFIALWIFITNMGEARVEGW